MKPLAHSIQPVVIIGAGRSGTNMLRDVLTRLEGVDTWPCDEINYIWRYGNRDYPTDELPVSQASAAVSEFIRKRFSIMAGRSTLRDFPEGGRYLVEKTCANSLRVPFVESIVPEAKYIYLVRDGRDVVASAQKRWKASLDVPYLLAKARYVPITDLGYYSGRYLMNRLAKHSSTDKALSVWGPKFTGMKELAETVTLEQVCAAQWARCVELSDAAFANMDPSKYHTVRYEDFVSQPAQALSEVAEFLNIPHDVEAFEGACAHVRTESVGKGRQQASEEETESLSIMEKALQKYGYL